MIVKTFPTVLTSGTILLAVLAIMAQPAVGAAKINSSENPTENAPVILNAAEDTDTGNLEIHGSQLIIAEVCPTITLGGIKIKDCLPTTNEATGVHWVTIPLPADIEDGTYLLMLTTVNGTTRFEVTLGAVGPAGADGVAGEDGIPRSKMDLYSLGCVSLGQNGVTTNVLECSCGDHEDIALGGRCVGPPGTSLSAAGTEGNTGAIQPSVKASYKCTWTKSLTETATFLAVVDCIDVDADTIP